MSVPFDTSPSDSNADSPARAADSPLGRALGLDDKEVSLLGQLFSEATAQYGINGTRVFSQLTAGANLGQALALSPDIVELIYARAYGWFAQSRADRAEPLFRALCLLDDRCADYWIGYGACLRINNQPETAAKAFKAAAALRPEWAIPHFHALELAVSRKDWDEARNHLTAYEARANTDTPPDIVAEVGKLRLALQIRQEAKDPSHNPMEPAADGY